VEIIIGVLSTPAVFVRKGELVSVTCGFTIISEANSNYKARFEKIYKSTASYVLTYCRSIQPYDFQANLTC
jgi:hypothetical protein